MKFFKKKISSVLHSMQLAVNIVLRHAFKY